MGGDLTNLLIPFNSAPSIFLKNRVKDEDRAALAEMWLEHHSHTNRTVAQNKDSNLMILFQKRTNYFFQDDKRIHPWIWAEFPYKEYPRFAGVLMEYISSELMKDLQNLTSNPKQSTLDTVNAFEEWCGVTVGNSNVDANSTNGDGNSCNTDAHDNSLQNGN